MKIVKLLILISTLTIGNLYAGCQIPAANLPKLADDKIPTEFKESLNICNKSGKEFLEGLNKLTPTQQSNITASISNCKCDVNGVEIPETTSKDGNHCSTTRSVEAKDGSINVIIKSADGKTVIDE